MSKVKLEMFNRITTLEWKVQQGRELFWRTRLALLNYLFVYTGFCVFSSLYVESQLKVILGYLSFTALAASRLFIVAHFSQVNGKNYERWRLFYFTTLCLQSLAWGLFAGSIFFNRSFDLTSNLLLLSTVVLAIEAIVLYNTIYRLLAVNLTFLLLPSIMAMVVHPSHLGFHYLGTTSLFYALFLLAGRFLNIEALNNLRKNNIIQQQKIELDTAREKAIEAAKVKSQFLGNMSHEIRSPMNGIIGITGLLLDKNLDEDTKKLAETIRDCSENLLTIINDILDFSKIESGKVELEEQSFELIHCIESAFLVVDSKAKEKRIEISHSVSKDVPKYIISDVTRLRQVLVNLLSNAVKFTERGSVKVVVDKLKNRDGKVELQFAVQDSGIGIPETRLDRLFKSFSQIDASTARKFGGAGLGLAICKRLCEIMGGQIWVKSKFGYGSTFYFSVLAKMGVDTGKPAANPTVTKIGEQHPLNILVAEDNNVNQNIMLRLLEKLGYRADIASNGYEAIEALKKKQYDVVFMDVQMPELSGLEATRIICDTWNRDRRPKIIAMTANLHKEDRDRCTEAGMDDFMGKPIRIGDLTRLLQNSRRHDPNNVTPITPVSPTQQSVWGDLTIDFTQMMRIVGGDRDLLQNAINTFIEESDSLVDKLELTLRDKETEGFEQTINSIKQRASTFIATSVIKLSIEAEKYYKNNQYSACLDCIKKLKAEILALNQVLGQIKRTNLAS